MSSEGEAQVENDSIIEIPGTITETEAPRSHQIPIPTSTANHNSELVTVTSRYPKRNHRPSNQYIEQC